jgi:hypothetical protein
MTATLPGTFVVRWRSCRIFFLSTDNDCDHQKKRLLMRPFVTVLLLGLFFCLPVPCTFAQPLETDGQTAPNPSAGDDALLNRIAASVNLSAGYRTDRLNWHIAGNVQGNDPTILSELTWSNLKIYQLKLANRTVIRDRFYLRGEFAYGTVVSGDNRDSDYNGDNRTQETSRTLNGVDGNTVWDASVGIGPRFSFFDSTMVVCPLLGYAVSEQDLNIVDGYQAISNQPPDTPPVGPIAGLDSRYQTSWKGPWLGVDLLFSSPCTMGPFRRVGVIFTGEYHWVDYDADANWNLRSDLDHPVSFSHEAEGSGLVAGATILFETGNHWGIELGMNSKSMTTDAGQDRIYYSDGTSSATRLNRVHWHAFTVEAGFSYQF